MPAASSRHPSSSTAVAADATTRKLNATPAEVVLRKSIPTATVQTQTTAPVGTMAVGLRQPRLSSQPTAVPARNGHAVSTTPVSVSPSAWLRLPTAQKTSTPTMSASAASALLRRIGHHVVIQWHDVGFVASGESGLHRRGLPRRHHRLEVDRRGDPGIETKRLEHERKSIGAQRIRGTHHVEMQVRRIGIAGVTQRRNDLPGGEPVADLDLQAAGFEVRVERIVAVADVLTMWLPPYCSRGSPVGVLLGICSGRPSSTATT